MFRGIFGSELRSGDLVRGLVPPGKVVCILSIEPMLGGGNTDINIVRVSGDSDVTTMWVGHQSLFELVRRPLPETRSAEDVRKDILILTRNTDGIAQLGEEAFSSHLGHLRRLLDEYELARPQNIETAR